MNFETHSGDFLETTREERGRISGRCVELFERFVQGPSVIKESISYCVLDGGKNLRAILCLWTHDLLSGRNRDACLDVACAIECMHAYSLIHDDLPCMDDDDLRRGKPSCHKKYGEAKAVLTGDALLNLCFEIITSIGQRWDLAEEKILDVCQVIAGAGGTGGLISGQVLDLEAEGKARGDLEEDLRLVEMIHHHKTARLIGASMEAGAVCAGADPDARKRIRDAGLRAGQAFQIIDDILDIQTDKETLGKTPGKDAKSGKITYPALLGIPEARARAETLIREAESGLAGIGFCPPLFALMRFILDRSA